jgi:hypothetical protein
MLMRPLENASGDFWRIALVLSYVILLMSNPASASKNKTTQAQVSITSPATGATASGCVPIAAQAGSTVSWVNFYIDNSWIASSPPYVEVWNTQTVPNGGHVISVKGFNTSDVLVGTSAVNVTVKNGSSTPTPAATRTPRPSATPTASAATFRLLPKGSALPSDAACAAGVANDTFEPRPGNATYNHTMPSASFLTNFKTTVAGGEGGAPGSYLQRADGQFTGSTDAVLKWASCKWGFDENVTRATAVNESHWIQPAVGDVSSGISLGIVQVKSKDYPSTCEAVATTQNTANVTDPNCYSYLSTAFDVDYKLAQQRACFEGAVSYLTERSPTAGYPTYPNGTPDQMMWGCVGWWYSGSWYDAGAINYISQVQAYLAAQTWLTPGF